MSQEADSNKKEKERLWVVLLIIFLSRLPFLLPGYGAEEDTWGLFITAKNISLTGNYEVSRLPGHPLQEYAYSFIWQLGPLAFNLLTALLSTTGIAFFILSLKKLKFENYLTAGIILAFIPVVYINSLNAMDYMWALAFIMASFYFLLSDFFILSGIFIGLAVGCRITSAAMIIPFAFWVFDRGNMSESLKKILRLVFSFTVASVLLFIPVFQKYGFNFFGYVAQIQVSFMHIVYKSTIGVWGLIGLIDVITILAMIFVFRSKNILSISAGAIKNKKLIFLCLIIICIYVISFIMLPQKAAFFIPLLPFVIILLYIYLNRVALVAFSFSMIFSSFFIGINLNDSLRGSDPSRFSIDLKLWEQNVSIDFLLGPVIADQVKRRNKIDFSEKVIRKINLLERKTVIIAGFWMNDILGKTDSLPANIHLVYYVNEDSLQRFRQAGNDILYLPEQDYYNDKCFKREFTNKFATPFPN